MSSSEETKLLDEEKSSKVSWLVASLILANFTFGTGLLNYPRAFADAGGGIRALIVEIPTLFLVQCSLLMICVCSEESGKKTYQDMVNHYCGKAGLFCANLIIVINNGGAAVAGLVVVGDQIDKVMFHAYGSNFCHLWYMNRKFTLTVSAVLFILPVCFIRNMASLKTSSVIGAFGTIYIFLLVIYKYCERNSRGFTDDTIIKSQPVEWIDLFKVVPTIMFSFDCHAGIPALYQDSLKTRNPTEMLKVVLLTSFVCVIFYNTVGFLGYYTFGDAVKSDFLTSYTLIDVPIMVGMAMMALKAATNYLPNFFCAKFVFIDMSSQWLTLLNCSENTQNYVVTVLLFASSVLLAIFVPNIGAVIATILILVVPGVCYFHVYLHPKNGWEICQHFIGIFYTVIGMFLAAVITGYAIMSYINSELSHVEVECT